MQLYQEAAPINRRELEIVGWQVRELFGCTSDCWLPVPHIIEHMLPELFDGDFVFRVGEHRELGSNHGYADPDGHELVLREDVYEGLVKGRGRDRMTAVHEMSHLFLHPKQRLYRRMGEEPPLPFRDPEWQAKCLAGTTMMPEQLLDGCKTVNEIVDRFGVSEQAARYRLKQTGRTLPN
jgi:hypothetical protein